MDIGGEHYKDLSKHEKFSLISYYVDNNRIEEAYEVANEKGNQIAGKLTLYLVHEHRAPFRYDPLDSLNYVPENYLYETIDEDLFVYVHEGIEEIRDWAFAFCRIKKLLISNKVKYISDGALSLNAGEIVYEGTKQEFIGKFLGKSRCFLRSHKQQTITCSDGELVIEK